MDTLWTDRKGSASPFPRGEDGTRIAPSRSSVRSVFRWEDQIVDVHGGPGAPQGRVGKCPHIRSHERGGQERCIESPVGPQPQVKTCDSTLAGYIDSKGVKS